MSTVLQVDRRESMDEGAAELAGVHEPSRSYLLGQILLAPVALALTAGRAVCARPSLLVAATLASLCVPAGSVALPGDMDLVDVGSFVLIAAAAVYALRSREVLLGQVPLILFSGVVVALALATVTSQDPGDSLTGFVRYTQLFVLVPVAVAIALRDRRDVALVCGAILAVGVLQGVIGTYQYMTGTGASYGSEDVRAIGTFGAADIMGMATVVSYGFLVALGLGLATGGWRRLVLVLVALFLLLPLSFSLSRGAMIAAVCAVAVVLLLHSLRLAVVAALFATAFATIAVAGFGIGSETIQERVESIGSVTSAPDQSVSDRYDLWRSATQMWVDHTVTGVGLKQFPDYRDSYAPLRLSSGSDTADSDSGFSREPLLSPHSMYFLVLSEQGFIGILVFVSLFTTLAMAAYRQSRDALTGPVRAVGFVAAGLVTYQLVDFAYGDIGGPTSVLMAVGLGIVARSGLLHPVAAGPTDQGRAL